MPRLHADRTTVTSREGPALTIRFTESEYAGLKSLVELHQRAVEDLGIAATPSMAGALKMLLRNELKARGLWADQAGNGATQDACGSVEVPSHVEPISAEMQRKRLEDAGMTTEAIDAAMQIQHGTATQGTAKPRADAAPQAKTKAKQAAPVLTQEGLRKRLVAALESGKITGTALATAVGVSKTYVSQWRRDKPIPAKYFEALDTALKAKGH